MYIEELRMSKWQFYGISKLAPNQDSNDVSQVSIQANSKPFTGCWYLSENKTIYNMLVSKRIQNNLQLV